MARILTAELFASADLVVEAPEAWHFPWAGAEMIAEVSREQGEASALLLGRRTYDVFAASWPSRGDDVPLARQLNTMQKFAVSRSLQSPAWQNTEVVAFDDIVRLKANGEGRITVAGSITLVESLLGAGLLDELRILTHPLVLGQGRRLFDAYDGPRVELDLVDARTFERGVQLSVYRPTRRD